MLTQRWVFLKRLIYPAFINKVLFVGFKDRDGYSVLKFLHIN